MTKVTEINYGSFKQKVDEKGRWLVNFSAALAAMKRGEKVARAHWGGYWFIEEDARAHDNGEFKSMNPMIVACLKEDGGYAPAQPYMEDLLAEDWVVIGREKTEKDNEIISGSISSTSISSATIHATEIPTANLLTMEEDDCCCEAEAPTPSHNESIYMLTEALRALDKDYDNTARAKIIDRMLQVLGL